LIVGDVTDARRAIASRYVDPEGGVRFAARRNPVDTVVRLRLDEVRAWDLSAILPSD
jgi:hypothetical protein